MQILERTAELTAPQRAAMATLRDAFNDLVAAAQPLSELLDKLQRDRAEVRRKNSAFLRKSGRRRRHKRRSPTR